MNHLLKFCFRWLFFMGMVLLSIKDVGAQMLGNKYIRKINSLQGLSHNIINDIEQDEKGFIWIATQDGLSRYDGYQFKVYHFDREDSTSISDNYIKSIYHDKNNHLWISTHYGLNLYNPEHDNFKRFQLETGEELDITKISGSDSAGLWISNYHGGILYFNIQDRAYIPINMNDLPVIESTVILSDDADNDSTGRILEKIASLSKEKQRILVVEDNEDIQNYFYDLLKDYFVVEVADNGLTGLDKARNIQPALVISDIMMPGLDGIELCKSIKTEIETSHIPVLLITANISHHIHISSLDVGADAYVTKPFKTDMLIARIYNLLKSRVKLREYYVSKFRSGFPMEDASLSKDEEFLVNVNKIINRNMDNSEFSITQLHEELCMSRTVFYNKIKSLTNCSPIDLIREVRLRKAADLLSTKQFKVYEVMYQVGFNDEKHFRQLFKNHFGVNPVEYQNFPKQI